MKLLLPLLAVALLMSCSKSENEMEQPNDGTIRIFTGIDAPTTKAVVNTATGLTDAVFMTLNGTVAPTDFSLATPIDADVAAATGAVTFTDVPKYSMNDNNAYFIAHYPAGTAGTGIVTWTIDGKTDVMRTNAVWNAGKFSAPITGTGSGETKLILNHQLSQVEVVCKAQVPAEATISTVRAAWGNIEKIEFLDAPTTMTYTLNGLTVANGTTLQNVPLLKDYNGTAFASIEIPENSNTDVNARAMLAPVAVGADYSFRLKITTAGPAVGVGTPGTITQTVKVNLNSSAKEAMVASKTHRVVLTFKADAKEIAIAGSTIDAWTPGSEANNDVEKPKP